MNNLDFLDRFTNYDNKYEKPIFLNSNFLDDVWTIKYSDEKTSVIDFRVLMGDGLYLTDLKHQSTLNTLKYWIVFHTLDNENERKSKSIMSEQVFCILTIFDALNILKKETCIEKYGFQALENNHIKYILDLISENNDKYISIYKIKERVINSYIQENKANFLGTPSEENIIDWDRFNSFYKTISLKNLYPDTILKPVKKPDIKNIKIAKVRITQEYENILNDEIKIEPRNLLSIRNYNKVLISLNKMCQNTNSFKYKISLPNSDCLNGIEHFETNFKDKGRFKTVPSDIIFSYIRKAIEFHCEYGNDIVQVYNDFYNKLVAKDYEFNKFKYTEEIENIFNNCLTDKLKKMGVSVLKSPDNKVYNGKERFVLLRENKYFYDLIKVYYGCVQIVIGALMARRQSELASLMVGQCIDENTASVVFKQSKSSHGMFGTKNTLCLPIDKLGIEMIKNIEKLHIKEKNLPLFSLPQIKNIFTFKKSVDNTSYSENIDFFIDYIQGKSVNGKRFYIRQHQLRRFFAMCFFWGSGFGSLDTLRWFLGHTNVEHVYHYITESTSGEVLRNVKTQFLTENIEKYENLSSLIKNRYNTERFDLIDTQDLESYIEDLLEDEKIIVEPEFIFNNENEKYKIIVKIEG